MLNIIDTTFARLSVVGVTREWTWAHAEIEGNTVTALHSLTSCKDHLCDIMRDHKKDTDGLNYKKDTLTFDQTCLVLRITHCYPRLENALKILNNWEKEHKIKRTVIHKTNNPNVVVLTASKLWMTSLLSFSIYASMFRMLCSWNVKESLLACWKTPPAWENVNERHYLTNINYAIFERFLKEPRLFLKKPKYGKDGFKYGCNLHGYGGIFTFSSFKTTATKQPFIKDNELFHRIYKLL